MIFKKASYDPFKTEKLFLIVIIFHTITIYCISYQINAALVWIKDFFKKKSNQLQAFEHASS